MVNLACALSQCFEDWLFSESECFNLLILFCNCAVCRDFLMRSGMEARRWISIPKHRVANNTSTSEPWKSHWKNVIETVWSFCSENATARKTIISAAMSMGISFFWRYSLIKKTNRLRVYTNRPSPYTRCFYNSNLYWKSWSVYGSWKLWRDVRWAISLKKIFLKNWK